jgi:hypothetical protein
MSNLPDHLRHAKHVGNPHPGCAVCWAKLERRIDEALALFEPEARARAKELLRPTPLTVSTEGVPVGPYEFLETIQR